MTDNQVKSLQDLEKEKLQLEIRELNKRWYKKSSYLSVIITGLAVAGTLIWTFGSGILDKKRETLTNEKTLLGIEIHKFEDRRDSLQLVFEELQDSIQNIRDSLMLKEAELHKSIQQKRELRRQKFESEQDCQIMYAYYEDYIDSLIRVRTELEAEWREVTADNTYITLDDDETWDDDAIMFGGEFLSTKNGVPIRTKDGKLITR